MCHDLNWLYSNNTISFQEKLELEITRNGATKDEMMNLCERIIDNSVKTGIVSTGKTVKTI